MTATETTMSDRRGLGDDREKRKEAIEKFLVDFEEVTAPAVKSSPDILDSVYGQLSRLKERKELYNFALIASKPEFLPCEKELKEAGLPAIKETLSPFFQTVNEIKPHTELSAKEQQDVLERAYYYCVELRKRHAELQGLRDALILSGGEVPYLEDGKPAAIKDIFKYEISEKTFTQTADALFKVLRKARTSDREDQLTQIEAVDNYWDNCAGFFKSIMSRLHENGIHPTEDEEKRLDISGLLWLTRTRLNKKSEYSDADKQFVSKKFAQMEFDLSRLRGWSAGLQKERPDLRVEKK